MFHRLHQLINPRSLGKRLPLKVFLFMVVLLLTLFPRLDRVPRSIKRYMDPNALINAKSPALAPLIEEFEATRAPDQTKAQLAKAVERFVYKKVPYEWDWNIWSNVDYFPTIEETIAAGREDCDGRAVVAASMLRHYGFESELVTDLRHVWVKTDLGEWMGPGKEKLTTQDAEGNHRFNVSILAQFPKLGAYSLSILPLLRILLIGLGAWFLLLPRSRAWQSGLVWLLILSIGLLLLRDAGHSGVKSTMFIGYILTFAIIPGLWMHGKKEARA